MSSHHIVKEKQEPALLIANGEACSKNLIENLLEWSPFVHVLDGAIDRVLDLGIKVDLVSGDFDSVKVDLENLKKIQFPIEVHNTPDQNKTDLEKGLDILIQKGFPAVNIIWATGKRFDHTLANFDCLIKYQKLIKIVVLDDHSKMFLIPPLPYVFQKWFEVGSKLSLMPFPEAKLVSTENLRYPLLSEDLKLGTRIGSSNEVLVSGIVKVSYGYGDLLVIEPKD